MARVELVRCWSLGPPTVCQRPEALSKFLRGLEAYDSGSLPVDATGGAAACSR